MKNYADIYKYAEKFTVRMRILKDFWRMGKG